jgi:hypothetical protein
MFSIFDDLAGRQIILIKILKMEYKYDVALSFAGEDREYVDVVAKILKENNVKVFYDKFEEVDLWGKDLGIHFDYVYRRQSKYFIPFISDSYQKKVWTNYEVRNAIARAIENKEEYILPVRFDKTELDGIRSTIGYLDVSNTSPQELASKILKKLGSDVNIPLPEKDEPKGKVYLTTLLQMSEYQGLIGMLVSVTVTNVIKEFRYYNGPYFRISKPILGENDTFQMFETAVPITFPKKLEYGEQYDVQFVLKQGFLDMLEQFVGQNVTITAHVTTTVGERFTSNEMEIDGIFEIKKKLK